ncbi:DUF423 domain-containing protein [Cellvibrio fibrivorans]|uniref:Uncharacterized membrane protein YgdD (TMEM256/DUF423 family) n=1 Tax=Cellvibrio fibrivorans TaxID=126350 RepID=A0ABU1UU89_9GAMM|nr:DUF423 domain-containing protein [Cellvibrio fibrivorans]MDR7088754.1 uncharacterized membrane protein YgdD (TMEM256/DUF423 family) [Cellvibrio fibrivorans]
MARFFLVIAAVSGFFTVVIGAFAAHGLKQMLAPEMIEVVKTGVQYQMYHALVLMLVALWFKQKPAASGLKAAGLAFILGTLLFSGSLYALALGAPRWLGPITPLGGLCFLIGWLLLTISAWRTSSAD